MILVPPDRLTGLEAVLARMNAAAPGAVWLGAALHRRGDDRRRLARLKAMAERVEVPLLALNDVLYAAPDDRDLQDVLSSLFGEGGSFFDDLFGGGRRRSGGCKLRR
jgi:error-prone DNA polymerase